MKQFLLYLLLTSPLLLMAQHIPGPEVDYRSAQNPYYWKHDLPRKDYWQQDVHYEIKARLDDSTDVIHGDFYRLTYWNNSPHVLQELYFHLYQNAFTPGSYYEKLNQANDIKVKLGSYEQQGLGTTVENIQVDGQKVKTHLDNTVLKVLLNKPLLPGDSLVVTMNFKTYFDSGSLRRRMKFYESFGNKHYDGVHWYPAITVYDKRFGWTTDQHLDKEFYNNFGQFDVWLTLPQQYIVDATGYLMNEEEVIPGDLKEKLKLSNYFDRKPGNAAPLVPAEPGKTKTWYFKAINVHNFAWTADPDYRMQTLEWNGIKIISLVEEPHAPGWKGAAEFTRFIIQLYSLDMGMYMWPKIIVADAKDGMEYPMLTLDNGTYPRNQSLLAHEVGHMWFYGMLGSNETYRAFLDEGFTQFLTVWSMDKLLGESRERVGKRKWITPFLEPSVTREERLYYPYLNHVITGYDEPLNTYSADFNGAVRHGGNYGLVYYKTGTMLYNLRYVLGDKLFLNAMRHYVRKWKIKQPYPQDFRDAIIEYTQVDLNWFFDEWLETRKYIDYSVEKVKKEENNTYHITFRRKGSMQMPLDFTVTTRDSATHRFYIPNTWFVKQDTAATLLPKWYGWGLLNRKYIATVKLPAPLQTVEIDPQHYLADVDLRNNKKGNRGISTWDFDSRIPNYPQWTKQKNYYRPDFWFNGFDGIQAGPHIEGSYLKHMEYSATGWVNTTMLQSNQIAEHAKYPHQWLAFKYSYRNYLTRTWRGLSLLHHGYYNAGIWNFDLGFEKTFRRQEERQAEYTTLFLNTKYLVNGLTYRSYLLYPSLWGPTSGKFGHFVNGTVNFGVKRHYVYQKGKGDLLLAIRTPSIKSSYNYSRVELNSVNTIQIKKFEIKSRIFGQAGFGKMPLESQLYLAGGNPEEMIGNKFTRSRGIVPYSWRGYGNVINHFQFGGGLNLRGYAGYLAPTISNGMYFLAYRGLSGASWNLEVDFDKYLKFKPSNFLKNLHLDTYFFSDMGIISTRTNRQTIFGNYRMDAGLGTAMTIKFGFLDIEPLVIRFDMPFFINRPPASENYLAFRYVLGINRAF